MTAGGAAAVEHRNLQQLDANKLYGTMTTASNKEGYLASLKPSTKSPRRALLTRRVLDSKRALHEAEVKVCAHVSVSVRDYF